MSLGSPLKSDDNVGNVVLKRLGRITRVQMLSGEQAPENVLGKIREPDKLFLLDALDFGGEVGEVRLFKPEEVQDYLTTTHNVSPKVLASFFPKAEIRIIGIQPKDLGFGKELSKELQKKLPEIVKKVRACVSS